MLTTKNRAAGARLGVVLVAWLWLPFATAFGQDYEVEILVYANLGDSGEAHVPPPRAFPPTERAIRLGDAGTRLIGAPRQLQGAADAMRRSSQYRPLLHWRWRQPGWERAQARPIHLQVPPGAATPLREPAPGASNQLMQRLRQNLELGGATAPDQPLLDGTVTLIRSQFLHLVVDLLYLDPAAGAPVQLKQTRRVRIGELHYLDDPRVGVLAQVTRATP